MAAPSSSKQLPCVYLSNLPYEATESCIREVFQAIDVDVAGVQLMMKGINGRLRSSGLACVTLASEEAATRSCKELDGREVLGRPVIVRPDRFESDNVGYDPQPAGSTHGSADDGAGGQ